MQNASRPWNWTPSPGMNRMMSAILRLPLVHRMLSSQILLLTFTGRKSGKTFTTPVEYNREGDQVLLLTKRFRPWWRNFQSPASVTVRIAGRVIHGQAQSITDEAAMVPTITRFLETHTQDAQIYGVRRDAAGKVNAADVRALAPRLVVIQIALGR